jgi:hydroxymethylbilane synthase
MKARALRIGSRGSELALWQATWVQTQLTQKFPALNVSIDIIKTTGDRILDSPLSKIGDRGLFTKEIEQALLEDRIDLAVHSLKDLPTELPAGLTLGAVCKREDVRDVFVPHPGNMRRRLSEQPDGAQVATGSLRRRSQLKAHWPDLDIVDVRGNLNTRMKKLADSAWSGMILAHAGIMRLGWESAVGEIISSDLLLPAVGQGALGIETRQGDTRVAGWIEPLMHRPTWQAVRAERALLRRLEGGCQIPIGAYARMGAEGGLDGYLVLDAMVGSLDGSHTVKGRAFGSPEMADDLGRSLAETLLSGGADRILASIRLAENTGDTG